MSEPRQYSQSEKLLEDALRVIPLGAQTFSKSIAQYPRGASPLFIDHAEGSRAWDVDGNEYVDFNNALCAVTLGHCDRDVTAAVERELRRGTIFSLSSEIEIEVARLIVETVPCAEKVRFGKNGSDATSGAIRAARAFTGRERVGGRTGTLVRRYATKGCLSVRATLRTASPITISARWSGC